MRLLERLWVAMLPREASRIKYIYKHKLFREIGKNVIFVPRVLPVEPEYIRLGNNVVVAARVTMITHDVSHLMLNELTSERFGYYHGCIEIGNNVFIGSNVTILPNVKIGDNTIVAAGSVVCNDIKGECVVGGVPARVIESFAEFVDKRKRSLNHDFGVEACWKKFDQTRNKMNDGV